MYIFGLAITRLKNCILACFTVLIMSLKNQLVLYYGNLYLGRWCSTSGSCCWLLSKRFVFRFCPHQRFFKIIHFIAQTLREISRHVQFFFQLFEFAPVYILAHGCLVVTYLQCNFFYFKKYKCVISLSAYSDAVIRSGWNKAQICYKIFRKICILSLT